MNLQELKNQLPEYAKDIKLNLSSVLSEEGSQGLTASQIAGTALACAFTTKSPVVIKAIVNEFQAQVSPELMTAAKAASTIMASNNVYYRFTHLASNKEYSKMPAKLRMNVIANPGVDKKDFELYSLAVSAINACGMCIDSHEKHLLEAGISKEGIQSAIRIAATITAFAQVAVIESY
jgi:alkyl hydroperoxide reductase subunit D